MMMRIVIPVFMAILLTTLGFSTALTLGDDPSSMDTLEHAKFVANGISNRGTRGGELTSELGFSITNYSLNIEIFPNEHKLEGEETIALKAINTLDNIILYLFPELNITKIFDDRGNELSWERNYWDFNITLNDTIEEGSEVNITIDYEGVIGYNSTELYNYIGPEGIYLQNYLYQPRPIYGSWFPSNGLAPIRITASVPSGLSAIVQGELIGTNHNSTTSTFVWEIIEPNEAKETLLVVNNYMSHSFDYKGMNITLYLLMDEEELAEPLETEIKDIFEYFSTNFITLPMKNIKIVETSFSAPHGQGLFSFITIHESYFKEELTSLIDVLAHEISHQWWGNLIEPEGSGMLWLSEGFATYSTYLYEFNIKDDSHIIDIAMANSIALANGEFGEDEAIIDISFEDTGARDIIIYQKGALVLHMMRYIVGNDTFSLIFQTYLDNFLKQIVTIQDFINVSNEVSQQNLDWFFNQWLYSQKYLDFSINSVDKSSITLKREGEAIMPVDIKVYFNSGKVIIFHKVWNNISDSATINITFDGEIVKVEIDPDHWLLDINLENNIWEKTTDTGTEILLIGTLIIICGTMIVIFLNIYLKKKRGRE